MKDQLDIIKAWAGASTMLLIQHFGVLQDVMSLALISITCVYTGIKAVAEYRKMNARKKEEDKE
jgi:hypothetical protein